MYQCTLGKSNYYECAVSPCEKGEKGEKYVLLQVLIVLNHKPPLCLSGITHPHHINCVFVLPYCMLLRNLSSFLPLIYYFPLPLCLQLVQTCVNVLVKSFKDEILRECAPMIKNNETASKSPPFFAR